MTAGVAPITSIPPSFELRVTSRPAGLSAQTASQIARDLDSLSLSLRGPAAAQPVNAPADSQLSARTMPPDVLEILGRRYGKAAGLGEIRPLAPGLSAAQASRISGDDGLDKIFFTDETGKAYVFFAERAHFKNIKPGYIGRFNGKRVTVDVVDDEANTFLEGVNSVKDWLTRTVQTAIGWEAASRISNLLGTAIAALIAAAAVKPAPAPQLAVKTLGDSAGALASSTSDGVLSALRASASVLLVLGAIGSAIAVFKGARASLRKANYEQLNMITGNY